MFSAVHHDLEGLAAERFRSLAGQLRRLQQQAAGAERLDALCRDEIRRMEKPSVSGKKRSVLELIADGRELRPRLLAFIFPNGWVEPLILNTHLTKRGA